MKEPREKVYWPMWIALVGILLVLPMCGMGCSMVRQPPAPPVRCVPLPACDIPQGANSSQLEQALQVCVLEYRALYDVCRTMAGVGGW
jgi:hypothetical protein